MAEFLVDVVAAARRLGEAQAAPAAPEKTGEALCPLDHPNAEGTRFCGECGLPMDNVDLTPRVDLSAIRKAVGQPVTAEEQARRDREHAEVLAANARAEQEIRDITQLEDPSKKKILIHFTDDGFTALGKVWQMGEMLEIGPEHPRWDDAVKWIRLSKREQIQRYGRIFFDFGPWPGMGLPDGAEVPLNTANPTRWSPRGKVPAHANTDGSDSLVPW